jgi:hypothetical protein
MTITCILPKEHQAWHTRAFMLTRLLERATFTANKDTKKVIFHFQSFGVVPNSSKNVE